MFVVFYTLNLSEFNGFQATRVNLTNTTSIRANYNLISSILFMASTISMFFRWERQRCLVI